MVERRILVFGLISSLVVAGAPAPAAETDGGTAAAAAAVAVSPASQEILARDAVGQRAEVLHVLIGWGALASNYGGRMGEKAKARSKAEADALAGQVYARAKKGEDFKALMKEYSEDWASAENGQSYTATPDASLVPPFKALSLRLHAGEVGVVETGYGWHVIKRVE